jgi:hypothetical protein
MIFERRTGVELLDVRLWVGKWVGAVSATLGGLLPQGVRGRAAYAVRRPDVRTLSASASSVTRGSVQRPLIRRSGRRRRPPGPGIEGVREGQCWTRPPARPPFGPGRRTTCRVPTEATRTRMSVHPPELEARERSDEEAE